MEKLKGKVKQLNKDSITVVASSDAVDRDGDILDPKGWDLKNFQTNPVLLWSHNASELPIGKVLDVHTEGSELVAEVKFATHEFAKTVETLVRDGFINTTSVGFMPQEISEKEALTSKQELLELSFVNVPSNPSATVRREWKDFQAKVKDFELKNMPDRDGTGPDGDGPKTGRGDGDCKSIEEKAGRVISEKNRNILRVGKEAMQSSIGAIDDLLAISEPQPKKEITVPEKKGVINKIKTLSNKPSKGLQIAKMMDKLAEAMIAHEKEKGVNKK